MTAVPDIDQPPAVHFRTHIMIFIRHKGKACEYIQLCHRLCRLLDTQNLRGNLIADTGKKLIFQRRQLLLRTKDRVLQFLQFRRNITLGIGQRLLADIVRRHQILIGIGHFQIISEYFIEFDPEIFDAGPLPLLRFNLRQPGFPLGSGGAEPVHILMITVPDHISLPDRNGRILLNGTVDQLIQILQSVQISLDLLEQRTLQFCQQRLQVGKHLKRCLEGNQIPRICSLIADPADQAFQIIDRA